MCKTTDAKILDIVIYVGAEYFEKKEIRVKNFKIPEVAFLSNLKTKLLSLVLSRNRFIRKPALKHTQIGNNQSGI